MPTQLNARFIMDNAVDSAVAVVTDAGGNILSTLPATNIQLPQHTKTVRTTNLANMSVDIDWGGATKRVDGVAIVRHNLSSAANWRVRLYGGHNQTGSILYDNTETALPINDVDDENWGSDPTATNVFQYWENSDKFSQMFFTQVNALSARITLIDAANPDGYMQVGRLFMGVVATPSINIGLGLNSGWQEATKQFRTEGGTLRSDPKPQFRSFSLTMNDLTHGERSGFNEMVRQVGMRKDWFVDVFPDEGGGQERDYTMACKFSTMPKFNLWSQDRHRVTFNLVEA